MKNKYIIYLIVLMLLPIFGCTTMPMISTTTSTMSTDQQKQDGATISTQALLNEWLEYELAPSRINYYGDIIFQTRLYDRYICSVYYDVAIQSDAEFYYTQLMQDFGWRRVDDRWSGSYNVRYINYGKLYINPLRQVAIYIYPRSAYDVFNMIIENNE